MSFQDPILLWGAGITPTSEIWGGIQLPTFIQNYVKISQMVQLKGVSS